METAGATASNASSQSIVKTLGSGSGIDTQALVDSLVQAQFAVKNQQLARKADTLTAQISGVAKLKSGITGFDAALRSLVTGGTLATQPTSSGAAVAVSALPGAKLAGLSARIEVQQLASAQAATTNNPVARDLGFRAGTLTIRTGTAGTDAKGKATFTTAATAPVINVAAGATIEDIAAQINADRAAHGLTATVVNDGAGARLSIKGPTGAANAFEIDTTDSGGGGGLLGGSTPSGQSLAMFGVGRTRANPGTTIGTVAADAIVKLDGATFTRSTNNIDDLVSGVRLNLTAVTDAPVALGTTAPTANLAQAVNDVVETYNQLLSVIKEETDPAGGVLARDTVASSMQRALGALTTTAIGNGADDGPRTLADLGVATARDGTLSVNSAQLTKMLTSHPDGVENMFAPGTGASGGGLSAALGAIATRLTDRTYGLDAASVRYTRAQGDLTDQQAKIGTDSDAARTRLTQQFSAMDAKVAAYKSTQAFLTQQIAAWNRSGN